MNKGKIVQVVGAVVDVEFQNLRPVAEFAKIREQVPESERGVGVPGIQRR